MPVSTPDPTTPTLLTFAHWRPLLEEAQDDPDALWDVLAQIAALDTPEGRMSVVDDYPEQKLDEQGRRMYSAGEVYQKQLAWRRQNDHNEGARAELLRQAQAFVAGSPALTPAVFTLSSVVDPRSVDHDVLLALYRNPVMPFALLSVAAEDKAMVERRILASLTQPVAMPPHRNGPTSEDMALDLFKALGVWRRARGLPASVDALRARLRKNGMGNFHLYVQAVQEMLHASLVDTLVYWLEWDALWHQQAVKELGRDFPPNDLLQTLAQTLDLAPVSS